MKLWMHAQPRKHYTRRLIAECAAFVFGLVAIVMAMSLEYVP